MTIDQTLLIVTTFATTLEAIAVAATLIYVIRQTTMTRKSIEELEKDSRFRYLISMSAHVQDINKVGLVDEELAQLFGYTKADILAFMMLDSLELKYLLRKHGAVDKSAWVSDEVIIARTLERDFVRRIWSQHKDEYHPDFVRYVEQVMLEPGPNAPTESA